MTPRSELHRHADKAASSVMQVHSIVTDPEFDARTTDNTTLVEQLSEAISHLNAIRLALPPGVREAADTGFPTVQWRTK